jgi:CelD/BcsL family acetyltransferase involved in cellulose biosynthesis
MVLSRSPLDKLGATFLDSSEQAAERRSSKFEVCQVLSTPIHVLDDPIRDPRWADLLERHPSASIFHTPAWLEALRRTYGYEPVVATTSSGPRLENGVAVCRVKGWTSRRLVSLPFSDHCEPLASDPHDVTAIVAGLIEMGGHRRGRVELRPVSAPPAVDAALTDEALCAGRTYCLHRLDLRPDVDRIFTGFHPSSTQRAIRRAEREGVTYAVGTSDDLLAAFYRVLRMSRRRHGLPPQPIAWFRNLRATMGDRIALHVASHGGRPIAALLTLSFKSTLFYKYGGSDASQHKLGAMPLLFWRAIQSAKDVGATELDLGRSDLDQPGLMAFKDHLGATRSWLTYYEHPASRAAAPAPAWISRAAGHVFSRLPDTALDLAGRLIYRHLG